MIFFLSNTCKQNSQKQWDVVSKNAANICPVNLISNVAADIFPSNKYDLFSVGLLLTNHEQFTLNPYSPWLPPTLC